MNKTTNSLIRSKAAKKAVVGALLGVMIGIGCAPIAPSLEKSRFDRPSGQITGEIPLNGSTYQTQIATTEPAYPQANRIALEVTSVNQFRSSAQVQILLGSLPPGGVRGTFVIGLPSSTLANLQEFKTEMFETYTASGVWILRVKAGVNPSISQMVRDHLLKIYLDFGVVDQSSLESDPDDGEEPGTDDPVVEPDADTPNEDSDSADPPSDDSESTDTDTDPEN